MTFCTTAMIAAFVITVQPGQVYMGDNNDFHFGMSDDLDKRMFIFPDSEGPYHCYTRGTFKGECIGRNTYRMTIESVDKKKKSFTYTSTVKMSTGNWKFSKVHRKVSAMDGFCMTVNRKELVLDTRKEVKR